MKERIVQERVKLKLFIALLFSCTVSIVWGQNQCNCTVYIPSEGCHIILGGIPAVMVDPIQQTFSTYEEAQNFLNSFQCNPCNGCTIICTDPCNSGGSDINTTGQISPGNVSFNGQYEGKPFFTPHSSAAFEDWAREYKQLLASYGITSILGKNFNPYQIPLTENKKVNQLYGDESGKFDPKTLINKPPPKQEDPSTVKLLRTDQDIKNEEEWLKRYPGMNNITNEGIVENKSSGMTFQEKGLRTALEGLPLGAGTIATGMFNIVDNVLGEDGIPLAVKQATQMDYEGGLEKVGCIVNNVPKEVGNTMGNVIKTSVTDGISGLVNSGIFHVFKVGETAETVSGIVSGAYDLKKNFDSKK
jgi:hypothetical protein